MLDTYRKSVYLIGREHRGRWAALVALAVVVSVFEAVGAGLVFILIGVVTGAEDRLVLPLIGDLRSRVPGADSDDAFLIAMSVVGVFFVVRAALLLGQTYFQYRVAENAGARLSARLLHGYFQAPYSFHLRHNSAELIRNAYDTVQVFVKEVLTPAVKLLADAFIVVGILGVLFATSTRATLLAIAGLTPLALLLVAVIHPRVKALGVVRQEMSRTSLQTLQQSLGAWRDIRVLGRERFFEREFARQRFRLARAGYLRNAANAMPRVVIETALVLFVLVFLGLTVVVEEGFRGGLPVLGLFAYAALRLQPSLNRIFQGLNHLKFGARAVDDLYDDVRASEALARRGGVSETEEPVVFRRELRLEGVTFRYEGGAVDALRDVNLAIAHGEAVGVVGPTGGGKTTLLDVILGLLEPTEGRVLVDGRDVRGRVAGWQRNIGMVAQSVYLTDDTLRSNIALGVKEREIDDSMVAEAVRMAQLEDFVAALPEGLDTKVGERGVRLSGGQRQRVAIARALYRRPSVLVFDEGTSALDTATEAEFIGALSRLGREWTIILVAHRLATVRFCDRIFVVSDGRLVGAGSYSELEARNPAFRRLLVHHRERDGVPVSDESGFEAAGERPAMAE